MIKRVLTLVSAMHITASVFINDDAGPGAGCTTAPAHLANGKPLPAASLCPEQRDRAADAHLKRHGAPSAAVVAVTNGRLDFGTWERIFQARQNGWHVSLDGRRRKRVLVKIIGA